MDEDARGFFFGAWFGRQEAFGRRFRGPVWVSGGRGCRRLVVVAFIVVGSCVILVVVVCQGPVFSVVVRFRGGVWVLFFLGFKGVFVFVFLVFVFLVFNIFVVGTVVVVGLGGGFSCVVTVVDGGDGDGGRGLVGQSMVVVVVCGRGGAAFVGWATDTSGRDGMAGTEGGGGGGGGGKSSRFGDPGVLALAATWRRGGCLLLVGFEWSCMVWVVGCRWLASLLEAWGKFWVSREIVRGC